MGNDRCADSITCNVDCCSCHIKDSVDTHDQTDCFNRKSDRIKYHGQCYKTNTWNTCCSDRSKGCCSDNGHIIHRCQMNTKRLCRKYNRNTLHDGGTVHVDGCTKRNGKGRNLLGYTDLLGKCINRKRNGRIGCRC